MNLSVMNKHERESVFIALIQDIHANRAELNRIENIVYELQRATEECSNAEKLRFSV